MSLQQMTHPSIDELKRVIRLDQETGHLFWLSRPHFTRMAGKRALGALNKHKGYYHGTLLGRHVWAHRVVFALHYGRWPKEVDHIDRNPSNNRPDNLREVTRSQNQWNKGLTAVNTSGFVGVCWDKKKRKWKASIQTNGKRRHVGHFDDPGTAAAARDAVALGSRGEI